MPTKQGNQPQRDVKPGHELDQQRERQEGHPDSVEQPGSSVDVSKVKKQAQP
jgi:hypothetical protein